MAGKVVQLSESGQLHSILTTEKIPGGGIKDNDVIVEKEMKKVRTYNNNDPAPGFLKLIQDLSKLYPFTVNLVNGYDDKLLFSGACYSCGELISENVKLQRCAGCQLVAYCNKKCQKADWKQHKNLCKKFPVENGKNVLVRKTMDWRTPPGLFFSDLYKKVHGLTAELQFLSGGIYGPFRSPRCCNICFEARPEVLFDCRCCCVSYCSKEHKMLDDLHMTRDCQPLQGLAMANWYFKKHQQLRIPDGLLNHANLSDGLKLELVSKLSKYSNEKWLETIVDLVNERLAFPMTINHALKNVKIGEQGENISEIKTLTIHIVQLEPMLDPMMWDFFMHQLPNLQTLNLTFISGNMHLYNRFNSLLRVVRCSECKEKDRVINYNIQPKHYHEYFASNDYVQPDVVVFFGIDNEVMHWDSAMDEANNFTSQMNMTYNKHTVVILTGHLDFKLEECVKSFHEARPVKVLIPVQKNLCCGFSTMRFSWPNYSYNEHSLFTCLQRDH